jgi:hypothetical protein
MQRRILTLLAVTPVDKVAINLLHYTTNLLDLTVDVKGSFLNALLWLLEVIPHICSSSLDVIDIQVEANGYTPSSPEQIARITDLWTTAGKAVFDGKIPGLKTIDIEVYPMQMLNDLKSFLPLTNVQGITTSQNSTCNTSTIHIACHSVPRSSDNIS